MLKIGTKRKISARILLIGSSDVFPFIFFIISGADKTKLPITKKPYIAINTYI
jgi:hypothetical protein